MVIASAARVIRRMRGASQSRLIMDMEGRHWVVKLSNNPQGQLVLANELLASRIIQAVGLPTPPSGAFEIRDELEDSVAPEALRECRTWQPCISGLHFGSRFLGDLHARRLSDYLPAEQLANVQNLVEFAGILCVDKWTANADGRQTLFVRSEGSEAQNAVFVDQGLCFGADWTFKDDPRGGVHQKNVVYSGVTGWRSFEPWLSRIQGLGAAQLWSMAESIPPEWYEGRTLRLESLIEQLVRRKLSLRTHIECFRDSERQPFPSWIRRRSVVVPTKYLSTALIEPSITADL